jgi:hypothetical protein
MGWIQLGDDTVEWLAFVKAVMDLQVCFIRSKFLCGPKFHITLIIDLCNKFWKQLGQLKSTIRNSRQVDLTVAGTSFVARTGNKAKI